MQLAAASIHVHSCGFNCLQQHRDRVVLMLGALKHLAQKWAVAHNALHHLRIVADAILSYQKVSDVLAGSSVHDSGIDVGELPEGVP